LGEEQSGGLPAAGQSGLKKKNVHIGMSKRV